MRRTENASLQARLRLSAFSDAARREDEQTLTVPWRIAIPRTLPTRHASSRDCRRMSTPARSTVFNDRDRQECPSFELRGAGQRHRRPQRRVRHDFRNRVSGVEHVRFTERRMDDEHQTCVTQLPCVRQTLCRFEADRIERRFLINLATDATTARDAFFLQCLHDRVASPTGLQLLRPRVTATTF